MKSLKYSNVNSNVYKRSNINNNNNNDENSIDKDVDNPSNTPLVDVLRNFYDKFFFYGIETPKTKTIHINKRLKPKRRGLDGLFFTKSEMLAMQASDFNKKDSLSKSIDIKPEQSIKSRIQYISNLIIELEDELELVNASLATLLPGEDKLEKELLKKRDDIESSLESLKIEYVSLYSNI